MLDNEKIWDLLMVLLSLTPTIIGMIVKKLKKTPLSHAVSTTSKLKVQFFTALVLHPLSLSVALLAENSGLKTACYIVASISFLSVWGVFDEIIPYYPAENSSGNPPEDVH